MWSRLYQHRFSISSGPVWSTIYLPVLSAMFEHAVLLCERVRRSQVCHHLPWWPNWRLVHQACRCTVLAVDVGRSGPAGWCTPSSPTNPPSC